MASSNDERKAVGIYNRPHPLSRPRVWLPIAVAVVVAVAWWLLAR